MAMPQPNFVPVRPSVSRRTQSNGMSGLTSTAWGLPLTVNLIAAISPLMSAPAGMPAAVDWFHSTTTAFSVQLRPAGGGLLLAGGGVRQAVKTGAGWLVSLCHRARLGSSFGGLRDEPHL